MVSLWIAHEVQAFASWCYKYVLTVSKIHLSGVSLNLFKFMPYDSIISHYSHLLRMLWLTPSDFTPDPVDVTSVHHHWNAIPAALLTRLSKKWMKSSTQWYFHTTYSFIQMIFLSFFPSLSLRFCEWMQYVTERAGSYVPCVCDVSPPLRWEQVPSDKLSVLSAGEVRGIAQCVCVCVRFTGLYSIQNVLDYLSCISQQHRLVSEIRHKHLLIFLAVSPSLVFICCLSNVTENVKEDSNWSIYLKMFILTINS